MVKTLELKLKDFEQALERLREACEQKSNEFIRDSVIKRFEFAFELAWKTAKVFLSENQGVEVFSPKEVFRELRKNNFISDAKTESLLIMTDDRNAIVHTYNQALSKDLADKIVVEYLILLVDIYKVIQK